ncbi:uncharacterized protein LOC119337978 [Triticum dicoccoides]|uniref:uncharacterized protein LOC119337978 n=1 Tax=Triticum dicoccoides TaxID=85692 RepID=UPI00189166DA|nr:uncharacterized protein LOC119337978 [Triticum dicoccoides]
MEGAATSAMVAGAAHLLVPLSDGSNLPPYKLIVTYGARSYKNYKVELCTVSSWSWDIHVERQTTYNQLLGLLQNKYPWGNDEGVVLSSWNSSRKYFVLVRNDEDVVNMYDGNEEDKIVKVLVQFCRNGEEEEFAHSLLQPIPPSSAAKEMCKPIVDDLTQNSHYEYEIPEENLTSQQRSKEGYEGYEGEDHVGIDEENQYLKA